MSKTLRTEKVEISMLNTHHTAAGYAYFFYHTNQFFSECEQYFFLQTNISDSVWAANPDLTRSLSVHSLAVLMSM